MSDENKLKDLRENYEKINKESEDSLEINNSPSIEGDLENAEGADNSLENKLEGKDTEIKGINANPVNQNRFGLTMPFFFIEGEPYFSISPNCKKFKAIFIYLIYI